MVTVQCAVNQDNGVFLSLLNAKVHFVGIGGIGMSGIAQVLVNMGCQVSGSDLSKNKQVEQLMAAGVSIGIGHKKENVPEDCQVVVMSSAIKTSNVEIVEARQREIPVIPRAEMLSELMRLKRGIAIAGSHGKTTTTSIVAAVMLAGKLDPTIVVGGRLDLIKSTGAIGEGEWLLAEADESDGSFLKLTPELAVITNIDNDHLDYYGSSERLFEAFKDFADKTPFYGRTIFCLDDPGVQKIIPLHHKRKLTYGVQTEADLIAKNIKSHFSETFHLGEDFAQSFDVILEGKTLGTVKLRSPGDHNVLNSLAAVAVGLELGMKFDEIASGISQFKGVDRRLQVKGHYNKALIVDDYGHHPTEIHATLQALKQIYPQKNLHVIFQPHRFSRTKDCWDLFGDSFKKADQVYFLDVYPAGEKPIEGIGSAQLAEKLGQGFEYCPDREALLAQLKDSLGEGDLLLTLGAGDVGRISERFLT